MKKYTVIAGLVLGLAGTIGILCGCGENEQQKIEKYIKTMGNDQKAPTRDSYMNMLVNIGTKAVDPLLRHLESDSDDMVRGYCCLTLGKIGDKSAEGPIKKALKDKDADVRARAAKGLTDLIKAKAIPNLIELLKDKHETPRESAQKCLLELGAPAVEPLINDCLSQSENPFLRNQGMVILGRMGKKVAPRLIELLDSSTDPDVQIMTAKTLRDIGDKSALEPIKNAAEKYTGKDEKSQKIRRSLDGAYNELIQK
ncbi:MAG TPA: HEAT repeat domain-containing protein [Planctomycetota bacterium]|nr:HEAT repeat domain-containing protein [Planctomycetota bacterium]